MVDFKEWLAQQGARKHDAAGRQKRIHEWTEAIVGLLDQMQAWLSEDDASKVLHIQRGQERKVELGIGTYSAQTMTIALFDRLVEIVPLASTVVGAIGRKGDLGFRAEGRVDMSNGVEKYMLYHVVTPDGKKWFIVDDRDYEVRELTKPAFEAALQDLLS